MVRSIEAILQKPGMLGMCRGGPCCACCARPPPLRSRRPPTARPLRSPSCRALRCESNALILVIYGPLEGGPPPPRVQEGGWGGGTPPLPPPRYAPRTVCARHDGVCAAKAREHVRTRTGSAPAPGVPGDRGVPTSLTPKRSAAPDGDVTRTGSTTVSH